MRLPRWLGVLALAAALAALPRPAAAQIQDTLPQDTAKVDTAGTTARYLAGQRAGQVHLPVLEMLGIEGPRPALTRVVIGRDSLDWINAENVGDVLQRVPGVYLWRGGWVGRANPANYQGRGATAVEYSLDGLPYLAIGHDSVGVDPALIALSLLERIEIERLPGLLRVHLFTRRHELLAARTRIGASKGSAGLTAYQAGLERRFESGIGFSLDADYLDAPTETGAASAYRSTQLFVQGGYVPSRTFGVQFQILRAEPRRQAFIPANGGDSLDIGFAGRRTDAQLRVSLARRADGFGPRLDLLVGRTGWTDTLPEGTARLEQSVRQGGAIVTWRAPLATVTASAFNRSRWTPLDLRAAVAWTPVPLLTARLDGLYQTHDADRRSRTVGVEAGLQLPLGLSLTGQGRFGRAVAAPSILADPEQRIHDLRAAVGVERAWIGLEAAVSRTAAFGPRPYALYRTIDALRPLPETDWLDLSARLRPLTWVTLEGWYSTPRTGTPDGLPPKHFSGTGTIRTKFLRTFPSGALDLMLQLGVEHWEAGVIGLDGAGAPVALDPATFWRSRVQVSLVGFVIYWDRMNLTRTQRTFVPGFPIPPYADVFGVRWAFLN